ncbi:DUF3017 domain-containing protein [Corynebacterium pyruviciproducens]|uniref:DUF3017 domain-containing protein n=1 Tax=Corynebacterium pyruviciproducens TaxID=598660 RepID=UPI002551561E|nr:DUF3017 domain-containing protein [Corynebacterium pyruviciproducens]MDK7213322.1 DUF3017 domain-containing protein [Corynebacterium pyruviciproducens]
MSNQPVIGLDNPHDVNLPPSRLPALWQEVGVGVFCVGLVAVLAFLFTEHWRRATFVLGLDFLVLSVLRAVCDSHILGVLSVRSRRFDIMFTTAVGLVMMVLAASVDSLGS